jgi:hypothetical protein
MKKWIILIVCLLGSHAYAKQIGIKVPEGECVVEDMMCFSATHLKVLGVKLKQRQVAIEQWKVCNATLTKCNAERTPSFFRTPWIWFTLGLVAGVGSAIGVGLTY